jgi:hypothetical protein
MRVYSRADYERIAAAIGVPVSAVEERAGRFEHAARWLRSDRGEMDKTAQEDYAAKRGIEPSPTPNPRTPSAQERTLERIADAARRLRRNLEPGIRRRSRTEASLKWLLKHLGIESRAAADDGPGDPEILHLLTFADESNEDHVLEVIRAIVSVDLHEQRRAAAELERLARAAAVRAVEFGDLTVFKGHSGDRAINDWIEAMLGIYREITGREPGTAVDPVSGVAGGHLIKFLIAAAAPVGIRMKDSSELAEDAVRSRVRRVLRQTDRQI